MVDFYIGLDLGQSHDYTALAIAERIDLPTGGKSKAGCYHLRHLERFKLGTSYPAVVERVMGLLTTEPLRGRSKLVVDATGVGAPVVDLFRDAELNPAAVTITGGTSVTSVAGSMHVPKRDLVSTLQVLFQGERLKVAEGLPEAQTLVKELLDFQVKINVATAHDSYGPWREGGHDDLVLAVALACWYGEKYGYVGQMEAFIV